MFQTKFKFSPPAGLTHPRSDLPVLPNEYALDGQLSEAAAQNWVDALKREHARNWRIPLAQVALSVEVVEVEELF